MIHATTDMSKVLTMLALGMVALASAACSPVGKTVMPDTDTFDPPDAPRWATVQLLLPDSVDVGSKAQPRLSPPLDEVDLPGLARRAMITGWDAAMIRERGFLRMIDPLTLGLPAESGWTRSEDRFPTPSSTLTDAMATFDLHGIWLMDVLSLQIRSRNLQIAAALSYYDSSIEPVWHTDDPFVRNASNLFVPMGRGTGTVPVDPAGDASTAIDIEASISALVQMLTQCGALAFLDEAEGVATFSRRTIPECAELNPVSGEPS